MKLSQKLKYAGIVLGVVALVRLVYVALSTILTSWIALIVLGLGAIVYFVGKWYAKKEK